MTVPQAFLMVTDTLIRFALGMALLGLVGALVVELISIVSTSTRLFALSLGKIRKVRVIVEHRYPREEWHDVA
jgi:hypothetical protein